MERDLLFLLVLCILSLAFSGNFNIYKDYSKEKVRPQSYADKSVKHAIGEYLSPDQKRMQKQRYAATSKDNAFNDQGSFFTISNKKQKQGNLRCDGVQKVKQF